MNQKSGGRLDILIGALLSFSNVRAFQAAASLSYYAIFSLFPLLLVLIAGGSYFLDNEQVYQGVIQFVDTSLPVSPELIETNLRQVLDERGTVGIVSLLTLFWAASGFFTNLAYNINLAWPNSVRRNFLMKRLVGLGMIAVLIALLILSLIFSWITPLIPFLNMDDTSSTTLILRGVFSNLGSWLMIFLLFMALFRWTPTTKVHWSATFWGALPSSIAWKVSTAGFGWYLKSGFSSYQLVYGSLGAIVALLFLIYIMSAIILFGAHLSAAIDRWEKEGGTGKSR